MLVGLPVPLQQRAPMNFVSRLTKLNFAMLADSAAKHEALNCGLGSSLPLSAAQLKELCALGEKMIATSRALAAAEESVFNNLNH